LKTCRICGESKPLEAFYKMKGMRDGYRNECKLKLLQFAIKMADQRGVCLICGRAPAEGKSLDVDHDHKSGRVRGLRSAGSCRPRSADQERAAAEATPFSM
jgi:hypothetical protein